MTELENFLIGDGYAMPPQQILNGVTDELAHRKPAGAPHSIYEELWHIVFWQELMLDWIRGQETAYPASPADCFPTVLDMEREYWPRLQERFSAGVNHAAEHAREESRLERQIRCPAPQGEPARTRTAREQLESLATHNAYHLGRIVLLRQVMGAWPPTAAR